jgi:archaellum component FlaC
MATVDFTLDELLKKSADQTRTIVEEVLEHKLESSIDRKLEPAIERVLDRKLTEHFASFIEHNLTPALEDIDEQFDDVRGRLDRIETEVKGIRRVVRKHSSDITELQAARGI